METKISSFSCEDQLNLHIVENLDQTQLPASLQQMLSLAQTPEEQDILLLSMLTAASACVPNLFFRYGPTGKKYFANLQCFILAAAASGKGIANQALEMIRVIDEQYPMLIAGDSTLPAWYKALEARRLIFDQLKSEFAHKELIAEAKAQGIPQSTILRWNAQWIEKGLITRVSHGMYKKVG